MENGSEAVGRPALRRPVLTDEQRDEIREAFDLYVFRSFLLLLYQSTPLPSVCIHDIYGWLGRVAPYFVVLELHWCCSFLLVLRRGLMGTMVARWYAARSAWPLFTVFLLDHVPLCMLRCVDSACESHQRLASTSDADIFSVRLS